MEALVYREHTFAVCLGQMADESRQSSGESSGMLLEFSEGHV